MASSFRGDHSGTTPRPLKTLKTAFGNSNVGMRPLLALPLLAAVAFCDDEFLAARRGEPHGPSDFLEIPPDETGPPMPPAPLVPPSPTACSVFPRCHALGLTGACCPPAEGTPALGCCEGGPGCTAYPACVALGLSDCCSSEDLQPHACCAAGAGACEAYQACVDSGLVGTCCPTEGPRHPCCRGIVVPQQNKLAESRFCSSHPQCVELDLDEGAACCPTIDEIYLECCNETDS